MKEFLLGFRRAENELSRFFGLTRRERRQLRAAKTAAQLAAQRCLKNRAIQFDSLNSNHFLVYLYWLSHITFKMDIPETANYRLPTKVYLLNKALHSVELYYEVEMPPNFFCEHPLGSVMGRANYGTNFFFYQNCTVGGTYRKGILFYPQIGADVRMYSGSAILGDSSIGNNVIIGAGALVKNDTIPPNVLVFGQSPHLVIKNRAC